MDVRNWTVCILEPNKFERQLIADLLKNAGVDKVRACDDAAEAMDLLEVYNANVVITSFELPVEDAAAWTKKFRRNRKLANRKAAVFVTSSAFSRTMAEQCRHAGANALIGKPLSAKVLTGTINKVLTQPREFIDAEGYVGPCRRAGIVTAGAPKQRRKADASKEAAAMPTLTLEQAAQALAAATAQYMADPAKGSATCEAALRFVQAYAVNAGDGPLMRACAAFALQLGAKNIVGDARRIALDACVSGVLHLVTLGPEQAKQRESIAESVREAVSKAALQRAA